MFMANNSLDIHTSISVFRYRYRRVNPFKMIRLTSG